MLPKNYRENAENHLDVSVFYIHPTTLYSSSNWNADTLHFIDNSSIKLCLENQASVFAGITDLYAPHYREMHIHSYTDTINGFKAYDLAYSDVINAFKFFIYHLINSGTFKCPWGIVITWLYVDDYTLLYNWVLTLFTFHKPECCII